MNDKCDFFLMTVNILLGTFLFVPLDELSHIFA